MQSGAITRRASSPAIRYNHAAIKAIKQRSRKLTSVIREAIRAASVAVAALAAVAAVLAVAAALVASAPCWALRAPSRAPPQAPSQAPPGSPFRSAVGGRMLLDESRAARASRDCMLLDESRAARASRDCMLLDESRAARASRDLRRDSARAVKRSRGHRTSSPPPSRSASRSCMQ